MGIYKVKDKAAAYGLGYVPGEVFEMVDDKVSAACLTPVIKKDDKGNEVNVGGQVMADKEYTADYLMEQGVILPAKPEEIAAYKKRIAAESGAAESADSASDAPDRKLKGKSK